ncbi:MAG: hypothetical protein IJ191_00515 [Treponema sp.]|nr:hypothetical protein [Treponema sp.]
MDKPAYSEVYDFENLYQAARETVKDKRYYPEELHFAANLEENLIELQNQLVWHTYTPSEYYEFWVYDPKERLICAPKLKDRIVHTALCRVLELYIEPRLDFDSYACQKGKGTLAAANRAAYFANKYAYFAYFDIRKFFDSVPILPLEQVYHKRFVEDSEILWLLHTIFMKNCNGIGIKKGCRTSQLSANVYLNEADHFIRHTLKVKAYVRYMDDFLIFSNSIDYLKWCWSNLAVFMQKDLFLQFNSKTYIGKTQSGFSFVGYKIMPNYKLVRKIALDRSVETLKAWKNGKIDDAAFYRSTASRVGHCQCTASYKWYCEYLLKALKFALIDRAEH